MNPKYKDFYSLKLVAFYCKNEMWKMGLMGMPRYVERILYVFYLASFAFTKEELNLTLAQCIFPEELYGALVDLDFKFDDLCKLTEKAVPEKIEKELRFRLNYLMNRFDAMQYASVAFQRTYSKQMERETDGKFYFDCVPLSPYSDSYSWETSTEGYL
jgi:hypothetical protein